jgi:GNAT superfamily N-acetyltransferase
MTDVVRDTSVESLAKANEASFSEGFAACARAFGGEVYQSSDLLWCAAIPGMAGWNRVLYANLTPETLESRIEWVLERARALNTPVIWNIGPSTYPNDLGSHLLRHGFTDSGEEAAMGVALARLPDAVPLQGGVTVERVTDNASLEQWAQTMCLGFGAPLAAAAPIFTAIARDAANSSPAAYYYLARLHDEPVATAGLTLAAGVASVFTVATVHAARRQGIGAAITLAPLLYARTLGYAVGVLQATEMGYPVYARLGFTEQFRYGSFYWQP